MRQKLLNDLAAIEDEARAERNNLSDLTDEALVLRRAFNLIAQLTQIIREELAQ